MAWSVKPGVDELPHEPSRASVGFDAEEHSGSPTSTGLFIEEHDQNDSSAGSGNINNSEGKRTSPVVGVGGRVDNSSGSDRGFSHFPDPDHDDESTDRNLER